MKIEKPKMEYVKAKTIKGYAYFKIDDLSVIHVGKEKELKFYVGNDESGWIIDELIEICTKQEIEDFLLNYDPEDII